MSHGRPVRHPAAPVGPGPPGQCGNPDPAVASRAVGVGNRHRGGSDRGCAGFVLFLAGRSVERDQRPGHQPSDRHQRPDHRRPDRRAAHHGARDDRPDRPGHPGPIHRGGQRHQRLPEPVRPFDPDQRPDCRRHQLEPARHGGNHSRPGRLSERGHRPGARRRPGGGGRPATGGRPDLAGPAHHGRQPVVLPGRHPQSRRAGSRDR